MIVVTGATGTIGRSLVKVLTAAGQPVTAVSEALRRRQGAVHERFRLWPGCRDDRGAGTTGVTAGASSGAGGSHPAPATRTWRPV
ncbi:NAD-dependent epimerase/dehydratase family protein [Frankia sp. R82]|uniref:NAD-dependent epimerase/dehydratase family protein n=1 Tax=Frankia sp. R82 TaxID=2950553 RepID=UPI002043D601|nr:NAD-dependent epimerase/dehydratase family protein [Frankia sp. R82]MCM3885268.1 NAD-dependent epimerase/dehydratase family protein [Frankia sp. R82]